MYINISREVLQYGIFIGFKLWIYWRNICKMLVLIFVILGWMPIEKLTDVTIYPDFIKETIHELDALPIDLHIR